MHLYLGVSDTDWYDFLASRAPEDINFWKPGGGSFKALSPGEPFLLKLKSPHNAIGGVGFFAGYSRLSVSMAWEVFGEQNGCVSREELLSKIIGYRSNGKFADPEIGCIVLTSPIFFNKSDWIPVPNDWNRNIVSGKGYDTTEMVGAMLWQEVRLRLEALPVPETEPEYNDLAVADSALDREDRLILQKVRVGQGAFRLLVTDAYSRRCAISGEKTLPVLEAAHIRAHAAAGPNKVSNGLLLRSDLHKLFDNGYLTVTPEHRVEVSRRIKEEFENGREYYRFNGQKLAVLPENVVQLPDRRFIEWHNERVYRG